MALDADLESPTFNCFCTVTDATALLAERLHVEPWYQVSLTTEGYASLAHRREAALIWATTLIDTYVTWRVPPDTWDVIPREVQQATAFYALALLAEPPPTTSTGASLGMVKRRTVGDLSIEYAIPTTQSVRMLPSQGIPEEIQALLAAYGTVEDPDAKYVDIKVF